MEKKKLKKGWAMIRVSSKPQENVQHGSLEQQENRIKRLSEQAQEETNCVYRVTKTISETRSGKKEKYHLRNSIEEALQAIKTRSIDFIFLESVSRLGRWGRKNAELLETASEYGVEIWFAEGGLYNDRDKGDRIKFGINNLMAEEESKDNQERVSKKQREAMVNNGKDTSTVPTLGLDSHEKKVGMYVPNLGELRIVQDIMERFCELKSIKATVNYCKSKGYTTKVRITKPSTDKEGNIIHSREIGGESFNEQKLRALLTNQKYRGYSFFKDEYNQFPKLQNELGIVRWEYAHYQECGAIVDVTLLERVDSTLKLFEKHKPKIDSKYGNVYLLTGILIDHHGNPFYGGSAKSGQHLYYYNRTENLSERKTIKKNEIEEIATKRLKQYFHESGTLEKVVRAALKNRLVGLPLIEEEIPRIEQKIKELENVIKRFSESIRNAALDPKGEDLIKMCAVLSSEKEKAESELIEKQSQLDVLLQKKEEVLKRFEHQTLESYLKLAMEKFDKKSDLQKKAMIQIVIPEIVVHENNSIELRLNPDPGMKPRTRHSGGNDVALSSKWRERRDSNPRPSA